MREKTAPEALGEDLAARLEETLGKVAHSVGSGPSHFREVLEALPAAVYTTDANGRITFFNEAAAELWGRRPILGEDYWCGSWRLFWPDGRPMAHDECPMAVTLRTGRAVRGVEAVAERPDGTRFSFLPFPTPILDGSNRLVGAVNMLIDVTASKHSELARLRLAAIVESSDDAILSIDLEGTITSWNEAAERLYGYRASEVVGRSVLMLIPAERRDEEPRMIERVRRGERVAHYETLRRRKDGSLVEVSLSVSPVRDADGEIVGASKIARDITERKRAEEQLRESESRYRGIFQGAHVAIWEEDFSAVLDLLDEIRAEGVRDIRAHLRAAPARLADAMGRVRLVDANDFAVELFEAQGKAELLVGLDKFRSPEGEGFFIEEFATLWEGGRRLVGETSVTTMRGRRLDVVLTIAFEGERCERSLVSILDISAQKAAERAWRTQTRRLETLNEVSQAISSDLDLDRVVQKVTDAATELSGAKFGAFFYNTVDSDSESYSLYALSGAPREAFESLGLPRNTKLFDPTFRGLAVVRSDDIRSDPRYGQEPPYYGMPEGHLPVVSYLAVPVISRSGEVLGGLFFGHDEAGVFTEETQTLISGIAAHAAIAIDNARLHQAAREEIENRREAEAAKALLLDELRHRVKNTLSTIQAIASQTFSGAPHVEREVFAARLQALANAHDLLSHQDWRRAQLREIVRHVLQAFQDRASERFDISGPDLWLDARCATSFAMALHELATNAVKYGALSNDVGRVHVRWELSERSGTQTLSFEWRESGGPGVVPPRRRGFGSFLIERTFDNVQGVAQLDFPSDGVRYTLEVSL